jgi:hypothetical protein
MRQTRRYVAALTAGLLLLTACSGEDNEPEPDPPPIGGDENDEDEDDQDNESVEEEDEEPYAVPDEIDEAYAEEVINVLLEIDTEALKIVLEQEPGRDSSTPRQLIEFTRSPRGGSATRSSTVSSGT